MNAETEDDWLRGISEEEVIAILTGDGRIPIDRCFLCWWMLCSWDSTRGTVSTLLLEDNRLAAACRCFHETREKCFSSLAAVFRTAREQQWQGWELTPLEDIKWAEHLEAEDNGGSGAESDL
jgi:hypothetical protein